MREDATLIFRRLHPDDYDRVGAYIQESARTLQTYAVDANWLTKLKDATLGSSC